MQKADLKVGDGGPAAPGKFVVRWRGLLLRHDDQMPMLFDSKGDAEAHIERHGE